MLLSSAWVCVHYFDVPGAKKDSIRMQYGEVYEWLEENPGTLIVGINLLER